MTEGPWGLVGALTELTGLLVALHAVAAVLWPAGATGRRGLPPLRCRLPGQVFTAVLLGFVGGQVLQGLPPRLGLTHSLALGAPLLISAAVTGELHARRPDSPMGPAVAVAVALVCGFLVAGQFSPA
ncbi:hypothetical protein [Streptomyces sp. NPDC002104]